jgi:hypothetical protein
MELKKEQNFVSGALILLCRNLKLEFQTSELRGQGFGWFHENYPSFPVHMEAIKTTLDVIDFWLKPTKTKAWEEFFNLSEELQKPALGVMIRVSGVGYGVLHTAWMLPMVPGYTRMERRSATSDRRGLILDTVPAFAESARAVWQP